MDPLKRPTHGWLRHWLIENFSAPGENLEQMWRFLLVSSCHPLFLCKLPGFSQHTVGEFKRDEMKKLWWHLTLPFSFDQRKAGDRHLMFQNTMGNSEETVFYVVLNYPYFQSTSWQPPALRYFDTKKLEHLMSHYIWCLEKLHFYIFHPHFTKVSLFCTLFMRNFLCNDFSCKIFGNFCLCSSLIIEFMHCKTYDAQIFLIKHKFKIKPSDLISGIFKIGLCHPLRPLCNAPMQPAKGGLHGGKGGLQEGSWGLA